ncbi:MAG: hypothetical protein IKA01_07820 [Alistipes sp.]|nr:hypothetical protein [Alistipes sp.]
MNKIEELVYHLVYRNPKLKLAIRNLYQGCYDLLPKQKDFYLFKYDYKEGFYLGFHDLPVLSDDDTKCLVQKLSFDGRMPKAGESESVGYLDVDKNGKFGDFHKLADTFAWNYHKGCRLQWCRKDEIIFNTAIDGKMIAKIIHIGTLNSNNLQFPIDTISPDYTKAITFSYERLEYCMPGYGYPYQDGEAFLNENFPKETGLFIADMETGERKLLVSLYDLAMTAPEEFLNDHMHYVTHSEFSHDGRYISFLHRWIRNEGTNLKRWTRIMVYDLQNSSFVELPSQISGSHYVWNKKHQLLASCIIDGKSCHVLFDMNDIANIKIVAGDILNSDGHQSFIDDDTFITDTYPDKRRMAKLYKVHIPTQKVELIANTYSPKAFQSFRTKKAGHVACDLHPRVSRSGKYVTFDCPSTGRRGIYIMKLD